MNQEKQKRRYTVMQDGNFAGALRLDTPCAFARNPVASGGPFSGGVNR